MVGIGESIAIAYKKLDTALGGILPGGIQKPIGMTGMTFAEAKRAEADTMRKMNVTTVVNSTDPAYEKYPYLTGYFDPRQNASQVNVRPYSSPGIFAIIGNTVLRNTGAYTTAGKDKSQNISQSHEFAHRLDYGGKLNSTVDFKNASGITSNLDEMYKYQYGKDYPKLMPFESRAFAYERWVQNPEKFVKQYPQQAEVFAKSINYTHKPNLIENVGAFASLMKTVVTGTKDMSRQVNELKPELWKAGNAISQGELSNLNKSVVETKNYVENKAGFWNSFFGGLKGGTGNVVNNNVKTQLVTLPSGEKAIVPAGSIPTGTIPAMNIPNPEVKTNWERFTSPTYSKGTIQEIPKFYPPDTNLLLMHEKDFAFKQRGIDSYNKIIELNKQLEAHNKDIETISKSNVINNQWIGSEKDYKSYLVADDKYKQVFNKYQGELERLQTFGGKIETGIYPPTVEVGVGKYKTEIEAPQVINQNPFQKVTTTIMTAIPKLGSKFNLPGSTPSDKIAYSNLGRFAGEVVGGYVSIPSFLVGAGINLYEKGGVNWIKSNPEEVIGSSLFIATRGAVKFKFGTISQYLNPVKIARQVETPSLSKNIFDGGVYVNKASLNLAKDRINLNINERLKGTFSLTEIYPSIEKAGFTRELTGSNLLFRGKEGKGYFLQGKDKTYEFVDYGNYVKRAIYDSSGKGIIELWKVKGFNEGRIYSGKLNPNKLTGGVSTVEHTKDGVKFDEPNTFENVYLNIKSPKKLYRKITLSRNENLGESPYNVLDEYGYPAKVSLEAKKINVQRTSKITKTSYEKQGVSIYQKQDYFFSDVMKSGPRKASAQFKNKDINFIVKKEAGQQIVYGTPNELDKVLRQEKNIGELITKKISPKSSRKTTEASDDSFLYIYQKPGSKITDDLSDITNFKEKETAIKKQADLEYFKNRAKKIKQFKKEKQEKQKGPQEQQYVGGTDIGTNIAQALEIPSTVYFSPVETILKGPTQVSRPNFVDKVLTPSFKTGITKMSLVSPNLVSPNILIKEEISTLQPQTLATLKTDLNKEVLITETKQLLKTEQLFKQEQLFQSKQEQILRNKQEQILRNKQEQMLKNKLTTLMSPQLSQRPQEPIRKVTEKLKPPLSKKFIFPSDKKKKSNLKLKQSPGFYVLTMKRKKPVLITSKPLSKEQALSFGVSYTKGTERATFKLVPTKREAVKINIKPITETEVMQMGYRAPVKRGKVLPTNLTFVQKRPTRMGTIKETKAIQSYKSLGKSIW